MNGFLAGFTVASAGLILLGFALDYAHRSSRRRMADGYNALLDEANERGRQRERKLAAQGLRAFATRRTASTAAGGATSWSPRKQPTATPTSTTRSATHEQ